MKHVIFESTIRDRYNGEVYDFFIFLENIENKRVGEDKEGSPIKANEKYFEGNYKIAYKDSKGFSVKFLPFYQVHNNFNEDIIYQFKFYEDREQIFVLASNNVMFPELLAITSHIEEKIWEVGLLSFENGEPFVWGIEEYDQVWLDITRRTSYIRRAEPDIIELIDLRPSGNIYYRFYIDTNINMVIGKDEEVEIADLNYYLNKEGWIKLGQKK